MTVTQEQALILEKIGITPWVTQQTKDDAPLKTDKQGWEAFQSRVSQCQACELHKTRTQVVFGSGTPSAALMIIGEGPGYHEDQQGAPFVGRAGQLLTKMLKAIGLERDDVFITNVVKCRPPNNRDPIADEVATCTKHLLQQIQAIQPRLILALGRVSAHYLLKTSESMGKLRRQMYRFEEGDIPLAVTYHPAYLLRSPGEKKKAWVDLQRVKAFLETN